MCVCALGWRSSINLIIQYYAYCKQTSDVKKIDEYDMLK